MNLLYFELRLLFIHRYANLPFARNIEKYVKYTPEQVAAMMDRFFDMAA